VGVRQSEVVGRRFVYWLQGFDAISPSVFVGSSAHDYLSTDSGATWSGTGAWNGFGGFSSIVQDAFFRPDVADHTTLRNLGQSHVSHLMGFVVTILEHVRCNAHLSAPRIQPAVLELEAGLIRLPANPGSASTLLVGGEVPAPQRQATWVWAFRPHEL
jgi:hypothetical protein